VLSWRAVVCRLVVEEEPWAAIGDGDVALRTVTSEIRGSDRPSHRYILKGSATTRGIARDSRPFPRPENKVPATCLARLKS